MISKLLTVQNDNKYCSKNPNRYFGGIPSHYYVNNNCLHCNCEKTYKINVRNTITGYFNNFNLKKN